MSHCVSYFPIFSQSLTNKKSNYISQALIPKTHQNYTKINTIKAESGNGRENVDYLQRASIKNHPQQQLKSIKRRPTQSSSIVWDRFPAARTVQQMMDTMERLMEGPPSYGGAWDTQLPGESKVRTPWEIKEGEREYKIRFDMPGMTREDVKVWVEEKMLVLKAEKPESGGGAAEDGGAWSAQSYGKYSFRIGLPENVDFEKIKAEVRDGVLYLTIPKVSVSSKILDINVE